MRHCCFNCSVNFKFIPCSFLSENRTSGAVYGYFNIFLSFSGAGGDADSATSKTAPADEDALSSSATSTSDESDGSSDDEIDDILATGMY